MRAFGGYILLFGLLALSLVVLGWLVLLGAALAVISTRGITRA